MFPEVLSKFWQLVGWLYFPEDPFKDIKFVCHMINTQLVVEMMVDLVVADEMYEKVGKALEILWWKPKNWTALKSQCETCLCVCLSPSKAPENDTNNAQKKWREGWLVKFRLWRCLSIIDWGPPLMVLCTEICSSFRLELIIPWWWWWTNSRLWLCVCASPLLFTC